MKARTVRDGMCYNPITTHPETPLAVAHHIMRLNGIRRLPVLNEVEHLVGIVTLGDIREAQLKAPTRLDFWDLHLQSDLLTVQECMSLNPITVAPSAPLAEAALLMLENKVSGLPVVEEGKVVGIITESDIFRLLIAEEVRRSASVASHSKGA